LWESPDGKNAMGDTWEPIILGTHPDDYAIRVLRFPWAGGDTSEEAVQRMLAHMTGQRHYLLDYLFHKGRAVSVYADVLETWVDQGIVCGRCKVTIGGRYVEELRERMEVGEEEEDDL
ncbi:MAG TPA: hypothetical protein VN729_07995, partial [Ktedonobacteraceae bacterium]|nr:hypothetical protein [Ktedonobacteraceae bacterium]